MLHGESAAPREAACFPSNPQQPIRSVFIFIERRFSTLQTYAAMRIQSAGQALVGRLNRSSKRDRYACQLVLGGARHRVSFSSSDAGQWVLALRPVRRAAQSDSVQSDQQAPRLSAKDRPDHTAPNGAHRKHGVAQGARPPPPPRARRSLPANRRQRHRLFGRYLGREAASRKAAEEGTQADEATDATTAADAASATTTLAVALSVFPRARLRVIGT